MKSATVYLLSFLAGLLLMGGAAPQGEDALRVYLKRLQGTWISVPDYSADYETLPPPLLVHIDPALIQQGEARIVVSEYCGEGMADYLHFALEGERLQYVGASREGKPYDVSHIGFVYLGFEVADSDTLLNCEFQETEYANYTFHRLVRMPVAAQSEGWALHLQGYLSTFLREGSYRITDPHGCALSLADAFGTDAVVEEMAFVNEHPVLFPMLEELGVSTPFDFIVAGTTHPGGEAQIYAIEWRPEAIYLYETLFVSRQDGHALIQGSLRFMLTPDFGGAENVQP